MRITYHELVGRIVLDREGRKVGRVTDLRAEEAEGHLCVTGLLVGEAGLLVRIGLQRLLPLAKEAGAHRYYVPWMTVSDLGKEIRLAASIKELKPLLV